MPRHPGRAHLFCTFSAPLRVGFEPRYCRHHPARRFQRCVGNQVRQLGTMISRRNRLAMRFGIHHVSYECWSRAGDRTTPETGTRRINRLVILPSIRCCQLRRGMA